jgi:hypothetical protein
MDRYSRPIFAISQKFLIANLELEFGLSPLESMVCKFLIANKMRFRDRGIEAQRRAKMMNYVKESVPERSR